VEKCKIENIIDASRYNNTEARSITEQFSKSIIFRHKVVKFCVDFVTAGKVTVPAETRRHNMAFTNQSINQSINQRYTLHSGKD